MEESLSLLESISTRIPEFKSFILSIAKIIHIFHEISITEVRKLVANLTEQGEFIESQRHIEEENKYLLAKISQMGREVDLIKEFNQFTSILNPISFNSPPYPHFQSPSMSFENFEQSFLLSFSSSEENQRTIVIPNSDEFVSDIIDFQAIKFQGEIGDGTF